MMRRISPAVAAVVCTARHAQRREYQEEETDETRFLKQQFPNQPKKRPLPDDIPHSIEEVQSHPVAYRMMRFIPLPLAFLVYYCYKMISDPFNEGKPYIRYRELPNGDSRSWAPDGRLDGNAARVGGPHPMHMEITQYDRSAGVPAPKSAPHSSLMTDYARPVGGVAPVLNRDDKAMPEIHHQLRKLRVLSDRCGVGQEEEQAKAVDMSKMSAYEQQQYKIAASMNDVRQNILELDNLPEGTKASRRSELSNAVRKGIAAMKKETAEAKRYAQKEDRKSDYEKLVSHLKKTEQLYRSRFSAADDGTSALLSGPSGGNGRGATDLDTEMSQLSKPMVNLHDDEEFQMFFEQTKQNDIAIDQALDRLSEGVKVLHNNAVQIGEELKVQKVLLEETEEKVDKVHGDLKGLNKKLRKTIKAVEKDRLCIYAVCFLLLLGLAGGIYWQISSR